MRFKSAELRARSVMMLGQAAGRLPILRSGCWPARRGRRCTDPQDRRGASARRPGSPAAGGQFLLPVVIAGRTSVISVRACATVMVNEQTRQDTGSRPPLQEPVPGCQALTGALMRVEFAGRSPPR